MIYYKIYLCNNYETENEISNRPLERGYIKVGAINLINEKPFLLVFVDRDMLVHEFYTGAYLRMCNITGSDEDDSILTFNDLIQFNFESVNDSELQKFVALRNNKNLKKVIRKVIFNEDNDIEVSTMEELAQDRAIQSTAYDNNLTSINPYTDRYINKPCLRLRR